MADAWLQDNASGLLDVPEFEAQGELLSFALPEAPIDSPVPQPVARVLVDAPGGGWDPLYDYEIPEKLSNKVLAGCRVRVPFRHGRVEGFVVERRESTHIRSGLRPIDAVISELPVLSPSVLKLCCAVADRYVAPLIHAVRIAVPARHARAERAVRELSTPLFPIWSEPEIGEWECYEGGESVLTQIREGSCVRAGVTLAPAHSAIELLLPIVRMMLSQNRGTLILAPSTGAASALAKEFELALAGEPISLYSSEMSHEDRYRAFIGATLGRTRVLIGTRSAAFVPVPNLGAVCVLDSLHSAFQERRSPYCRAGEVLLARSDLENCSFFSFDRGPALWLMGRTDFPQIVRIRTKAAVRRLLIPQIALAQDAAFEGAPWARMPDIAFRTIREGLTRGDVLIQVPHAGYIPVTACARCGVAARCAECGNAIEVPAPDAQPRCSRCGLEVSQFCCSNCGFKKLKAVVIGSGRTTQEIGAAFPAVPIVQAHTFAQRADLDSEGGANGRPQTKSYQRTRIVVATPGSELPGQSQFAAAVVLDAGAALRGAALNGEELFFRSLGKVARLVRGRSEAGILLAVGAIPDVLVPQVRTLEWQDWAHHTIQERSSLQLPPAAAWFEVSGIWADVKQLLSIFRGAMADSRGDSVKAVVPMDALLAGGIHKLAPEVDILGPTENADGSAILYLRTSSQRKLWIAQRLRRSIQELALRYSSARVRVRVDPSL